MKRGEHQIPASGKISRFYSNNETSARALRLTIWEFKKKHTRTQSRLRQKLVVLEYD